MLLLHTWLPALSIPPVLSKPGPPSGALAAACCCCRCTPLDTAPALCCCCSCCHWFCIFSVCSSAPAVQSLQQQVAPWPVGVSPALQLLLLDAGDALLLLLLPACRQWAGACTCLLWLCLLLQPALLLAAVLRQAAVHLLVE